VVPHDIFLTVLLIQLVQLAKLGALLGLFLAIAVKLLEPSLTFGQTFRMSIIATAVSLLVMYVYLFVYYGAKMYYGAETELEITTYDDALVEIAVICLAGTIVTRLSRNYGIKKEGWFGVGGRAIGWIVALFMMLFIIVFLLQGY